MKLLKLEFNGFKSFYDKTKIDFHSNINAIVGPNGCGKSNIIDAIKWVLGEQNPRNLRAMTMEEVISNGGETLKPLGMAEVSLVVSSNGQDSGYEEINVKRRLFRSGQSEYYINNVPCRLKDITELFVDTGIGARAYSIIGQGKVESIITSKPEGKREVIEEVAGVGKYKLRRKETQSKIESTKNNLTIVRESQSEILRQIKSLKKQADDAEKYKNIAKEVEEIEIKVLTKKKLQLDETKSSTRQEHERISSELSGLSDTLTQLQDSRRQTLTAIEAIENEVDLLKNEYFEDTKRLQSADNGLELNRREERTLYDTISTIKTDEINSLREIENIKNTTTQKLNELKTLLFTTQEKQNELAEKQKLTDTYKNELQAKKHEYNEHREGLLKSLDEYGSLKTKVVGIEKDVKELESRIYRLGKEKIDVNNKLALNTSSLRQSEGEFSKVIAGKVSVAQRLKLLSDKLYTLRKNRDELLSNLQNHREKYNQAKSDLTAIEKIQSNYEWLPSELGSFILDHKGREVLGLVADFISVPENYDAAVEAVLGEKLNWSVTNNLQDAYELINLLKQQKAGKGTFIPLEINKKRDYQNNDSEKLNMQPLLGIINTDPRISDVINNLLHNVYIADSLLNIPGLDEKLQKGFSFVTLDGDYIDSIGFISAGISYEGVFERKREIEQLTIVASEQRELISTSEKQLSGLDSRIDKAMNAKSKLESELRTLDIKEAEIGKDISNLTNICKSYNENYSTITFELDSYKTERHNKVLSLTDLSNYINDLEIKKNRFETGFKDLDLELKELESKDQQASNYLNQSKVEIAGLKERINGLEQEASYYSLRIKELSLKVIQQQSDYQRSIYSKAGLVKNKIELAREKEQINSKITADNEKLSAVISKKKQIEQELTDSDIKISEISGRIEELKSSGSQLDLKLNSLDIEIRHLSEGKNLTGIHFTEEELDFNTEDMENRLLTLKNRLERFGPVNLLAPEEYLKLEERNKFLTDQVEDLENAMEELKKAITKLDRESKARFKETFDLVSEKFNEIFPMIFKGGEGKLELTDPDDLLNSGVEVYVRPKGKKLQSINLLSGGEKALSAITLILSACFIKPAPFLLLDEIDAPLDDNNTRSFIEVVKEISKKSQILLITHNKNTMHDVNYLIGITSQEPGTSKVVSVELH